MQVIPPEINGIFLKTEWTIQRCMQHLAHDIEYRQTKQKKTTTLNKTEKNHNIVN
jgi:hypothetical protein